MKTLKPKLKGEWRTIAPKPNFSGILPALSHEKNWTHEINDHHIFRGPDGAWHLWACVRRTPVGRVLAHWEADKLDQSPWRFTGEVIRADKSAGESQVHWNGEEFLQSPFIVEDGGIFHLFYGGYATGIDPDGSPTQNYDRMENQICLMTSTDGRKWTRRRNADGTSRLFAGPGAVRDEFLAKFDGLWHMYYSGHHDGNRNKAGIYLRTSQNLIEWSDWNLAHFDAPDAINSKIIPESPVVIGKNGIFYLFRTSSDRRNVLVSDSPDNFGIGDCSGNYLCSLPDVVAPEIIADEKGDEWITTINDGNGYSVKIRRLEWR